MDQQNNASRQQLDIRKYPNRRYYDATRSRHLTLEEIRDLVRDGCDIKVTDSKTGADITAQLLTQIILELETPKLETFPVNMLVQMIRANERVVADFAQKYFGQAFSAYMAYQKQMEEGFRQIHGMPGGINPFAAWSQSVMNPFMAGKPGPGPANPAGTKPDSANDPLQATIAELRQQMAEMREQMERKREKKKRT